MISLGIFAKTFERNSVLGVLRAVKDHGFSVAHFNFACLGMDAMPDVIPDAAVQEIRAAVQESGIQLVGISATYNMAHPNEQIRRDGLEKLETIAAVCPHIEAPLITLCTGTRNTADKWAFHPDNNSQSAWLDMAHSMEQAIVIAEQYNVFLGIEPELANIISDPVKADQLIKEMGSDRLKIIFDPANLFEAAGLPEVKRLIASGIDLLSPHIAMAHAKDRTAESEFTAPGRGMIPFDYLLEQMAIAGVDAPLIAHGFAENEAGAVADYLKSCL
ncbi:MAG: sugar phosphate isomerase/epimerase family protein [Saprospiraceae bacterium]|nr:sugar phosphate isomerase/epimerase [Lewinella sp.]